MFSQGLLAATLQRGLGPEPGPENPAPGSGHTTRTRLRRILVLPRRRRLLVVGLRSRRWGIGDLRGRDR